MDSFTLNKVEFDAVRRILSEFCSCSLGRELALRISPSRNPVVIESWLAQVSQMEIAIRDAGLPPLAGLGNLSGPLMRAKPGGGASGEDFAAIGAALTAAGNVRAYLAGLDASLGQLHELEKGVADFAGEVAAIESIIEPDGRVRDEASVRLADVRRQIAQTAQHIHDVIYGYLRDPEVAKLLQNPTVTLHGDRYVLPVKSENRGRLTGVVHRESNTGATVFVEPNQSVELNNRLSDLAEDERDEIRRLLNQLAIRISGRLDEIAASLRTLAQVDLVSAKAQYSRQFEMTCPTLSERGTLQVNQARHPLLVDQAWRQERAGVPAEKRLKVVPIDVRLGMDFDLLVLTGSNTGGKTVTLKTVAILVLMAQSGMHIPAQRGAALPVFHDVFIDIGDEQSLEQSLSTFGAHMKRIRYVLSKADRNSLVLLDELGSGTDPDEGGAIGQAILDELRRIGCLGMVTTHLSVLKAYAFGNARVDNASVDFDTATLSPTYHLIIGRPGESHAITVAQKLGLPKRIVGAARQHLAGQGKQFRKAIAATNAVRQVAEEARASAQAAQLDALSQQEVYQSKLADLHRLQGEFETWLARLGEMKAGDEIFVPSLNKVGHLVRMELHRQIALVDADNVQVEVPLKQLMPDLGQDAVREQIAALRKQILDQAGAAEQARAEAMRIHDEYHRSLSQQKERARQFDYWLGSIGRLKVGDEVPISKKPGKGTVLNVELNALRATLQVGDEQMTLSLSELFPQTGPFAHLPQHPPAGQFRQRPQFQQQSGQAQRPGQDRQQRQQGDASRRDQGKGQGGGEHGQARQQGQPAQPLPDRPMHRRDPQSRGARADIESLKAIAPGEQVFVVPFNKRATVIRVLAEKGQAIVQSGIFEMQLPLADLEPIRQTPPPEPKKKPPKPAPTAQRPEQVQKPAEPPTADQPVAEPSPVIAPPESSL